MQVAEVLVSHGASLNARTFLDETPIGKLLPSYDSLYVSGHGYYCEHRGGVKCFHCFLLVSLSLSHLRLM